MALFHEGDLVRSPDDKKMEFIRMSPTGLWAILKFPGRKKEWKVLASTIEKWKDTTNGLAREKE